MNKELSYMLCFSLTSGIVGMFIFNDISSMMAFLKSFSLGLLMYILLSVSGVLTHYANESCGHAKYEIL